MVAVVVLRKNTRLIIIELVVIKYVNTQKELRKVEDLPSKAEE